MSWIIVRLMLSYYNVGRTLITWIQSGTRSINQEEALHESRNS